MINKFKKIIYIISSYLIYIFTSSPYVLALSGNEIDPNGASIINNPGAGLTTIQTFIIFIREFLFNVLWIVAVGAFIYVGYLFVTARGKPDEFKKAWTHVIYIVVGILLVSAAWGIVNLVAGIDL